MIQYLKMQKKFVKKNLPFFVLNAIDTIKSIDFMEFLVINF